MTTTISLLLTAALTLSSVPGDDTIPSGLQVGEEARFNFKKPLLFGDGIKSLEDLRGSPVLVMYWGHTTWGAENYVQDVLNWQRQWGEDLAVIFVESQGASDEVIEHEVLKKKFLGTRAMWTNEYTVNTGLAGIPIVALLDLEGRLVRKDVAGMAGMGLMPRKMEAFEDDIERLVELRRSGPEDAPASAKKAYAAFAKGHVDEAFALADEAGDGALSKDFRSRIERRLAEANGLFERGDLMRFEEKLATLRGIEHEAFADAIAALVAKTSGEDYATEMEAAKKFVKVEKKLYTKGLKKPNVRALEKYLRKYADSRTGARAARYLAIAEAD